MDDLGISLERLLRRHFRLNNELDNIWQNAKQLMEQQLSKPNYETWIRALEPISLHEDMLVLAAPSDFVRTTVETRYLSLLENTMSLLLEKRLKFSFVAPTGTESEREPVQAAVTSTQESETSLPKTLNSKYTFDTFVIGNSNRFAHAASLAVAEMPARAYNPLFVYGGVGLGKTHLMQAIGHHALRSSPKLRILYVSTETFTNEMINSIRDDKVVSFRNRYRNIDILLIDDIQFLSGKERTQEEFFHTFEALHNANKQIVISSDRPPKEIEALADRLRSRFEWGLITDIQLPDLETRIAILRKKAQVDQLYVPDEVMNYIASKIETNVRELEGALIRLMAYASLQSTSPSVELAEETLRDLIGQRAKSITIKHVQEVIANYYNLSMDELSAKKRSRNIAFPRQIAMYLVRELTDYSLPKIGQEFGGRDHTTVLHAFEKIKTELGENSDLRLVIAELSRRIKQA